MKDKQANWILKNCAFASEGDISEWVKIFESGSPLDSPKNIRNLRKNIATAMNTICQNYYPHIPLKEIETALAKCGVEMEKNFMLTGHEGKADIELRLREKELPFALHLSWYRMQSGRFEINAYLT